MYLKKLALKNVGPIKDLSIDLPFSVEGNPKPIIFVGGNGSGKTILESQIMDGLYEISCKVFDNITKYEGLKRNFYKISGNLNLTLGEQKGFSALVFNDSKNNKIEYLDPMGNITNEDLSIINDFSLGPIKEKNISKIAGELKENMENEWISGAYFYEPAYRYEEPFWKNRIFSTQEEDFENKRYTGTLNKEIEITNSNNKNKNYLMNLVLDYSINKNNEDKSTWSNINQIIRLILADDNARFGIGPRGFGNRISIVDDYGNGKVNQKISNIDQLSLGESVLLNTFINIIRHGDIPPKSIDQIEGIVIIDEIDQHLHIYLQGEVLPQLIQLFPKIQFILTSHSPLFLLGMEKVFGKDGFEIRNMPNGELITAEKFSEFGNAYNVFKQTECFEKDLEENLKRKIGLQKRPLVLVEGPTDIQYIKKAYELYNKPMDFDIDIIGSLSENGTKGSNDKYLKRASEVFLHNTKLFSQKILLLHDPENNTTEKEADNKVFIRIMPSIIGSPIEHGIEHLFKYPLIRKIYKMKKTLFKQVREAEDKETYSILPHKQGKKEVANRICNNAEKKDFKNFEGIFKIIDDMLKS